MEPTNAINTHKIGQKPGYRVIPLSFERQMVASTLSIGHKQHNIHALFEVDISEPRRLMRAHKADTGESLSLTAYIIACLGRAVAEHPHLNAFRKGRKLVLLDNVTIGTLFEREFNGERVPENIGIRAAQAKSCRQIHDEIRAIQEQDTAPFGALSGSSWVRFIPRFLLKMFVRLASGNLTMMERYGVVAVTAVGMFGSGSMSLIPIVGGATVGITVGGIESKPALIDGKLASREYLHLTATFNHDIVDGAPAARFVKRFSEILEEGGLLQEALADGNVQS